MAQPLCTQRAPPGDDEGRSSLARRQGRWGARSYPNPHPLTSPCVSPSSPAITCWLYWGLHPLRRFQTHIVLKTHPLCNEKLKFPQLGAEVGAPRDSKTLWPQSPAQGHPEPSTDHPQGSLWARTSHVISDPPTPPPSPSRLGHFSELQLTTAGNFRNALMPCLLHTSRCGSCLPTKFREPNQFIQNLLEKSVAGLPRHPLTTINCVCHPWLQVTSVRLDSRCRLCHLSACRCGPVSQDQTETSVMSQMREPGSESLRGMPTNAQLGRHRAWREGIIYSATAEGQVLCLEEEMTIYPNTLAWKHSMDCLPPGSSVHGVLQAKILEWVAICFSRGSS